jgi:DNA-binding response OmpR family regulator
MNGHTDTRTAAREPTNGDEQADAVSVLVVDDEAAVADLYGEMLAERYDVETAYGGTEALEVVDETFDIVLLDRRMPDRSGDEVLREMRRRNLDCRVAMVTAVEPDLDIIDMAFDDVDESVAGDGLDDVVVERLRMVAEYQAVQLELSSKRVTRNVLRTEKSDFELADSERFGRLERRIEELESTLSAIERELDDHYLTTPNVA